MCRPSGPRWTWPARQTAEREPPDPFDREEVEKIIDHARANFAPTVANLIAFRFFSGLRTSEMVALRWQSIDCNKMQVLTHKAACASRPRRTRPASSA